MEYGFWLPIFGGWLRNVEDEQMPATFDYAKQVAQTAEQIGFSTTLIAELNLNDIKGLEAPSLEAWTTAAAIAATTERLEIMTAVRPGFHNPATTAKMAANIDQLSNGRFTLNVRLGLVGRRSAAIQRDLHGPRRTLCADGRVCHDHERIMGRCFAVQLRRELLYAREDTTASEAGSTTGHQVVRRRGK